MEVAIINLEPTYPQSLQNSKLSPFGIPLNPAFQQTLQINNPMNGTLTRTTRSKSKSNSSLPTFADSDSGSNNESDFGSQELGDDLPQSLKKETSDRGENRVLNNVPGCNCQYCTGLFTKEGPSTTWRELLPRALLALTEKEGRQFFQMKKELLPYLEAHWKLMWEREKVDKWAATVGMVLSKYGELFKSGQQELGVSGYWGLRNPGFEVAPQFPIKTDSSSGSETSTRKRKKMDSPMVENKVTLFEALIDVADEELAIFNALEVQSQQPPKVIEVVKAKREELKKIKTSLNTEKSVLSLVMEQVSATAERMAPKTTA